MGSYNSVAEAEKLRKEKGMGRVAFKHVIYGEEKRCPACWTKLIERESPDGTVTEYCFNCYAASNK